MAEFFLRHFSPTDSKIKSFIYLFEADFKKILCPKLIIIGYNNSKEEFFFFLIWPKCLTDPFPV